jgi:hypothetical protein
LLIKDKDLEFLCRMVFVGKLIGKMIKRMAKVK